MAEGTNNKDVIYVDVDDEITSIIDKARSSKHQIVALVLPKRSAVLQSIVNMKLLKRTADEAKKNVVLITADEGLLPLAGSVGMHVARNLQSKPEIPQGPPPIDTNPEVAQEAINMGDEVADEPIDKSKTLGELSGVDAADDAAIELDNSEDQAEKPVAGKGKKNKKDKKSKKNKSLMVPDFNRFRTWLLLGGCLLVVLIILLYIALTALPRATITINTNSQTVASNLQITLSSSATKANTGADVIPAQTAQTQKTYTGTTNTTGQQNNGTAANGSVSMSAGACSGNVPSSIADGSGISANGLTYLLQSAVSFAPSVSHGKCTFVGEDDNGNTNIAITAQSPGTKYNVSSATFSVNGDSSISASGSASGGTDSIVQVVAQADVTSAQNKINTSGNDVKSQLESDLQSQGLYPIPATFTASTPTPNPSASVGSQATSVTVTESITYTMYGAKQSDLQKLIASNVNGQISTASQKILDYGLSSASFSAQNQSSNSEVVTMQDNALVGSALNPSSIKSKAAGQKPGTAQDTIRGYSGVTSVNVHLSPFWVTSIPKNTSKITVKIVNPKS